MMEQSGDPKVVYLITTKAMIITKTKAKTGIKNFIMSVIRAKVLIMTRTMDNGHDQGSTFRLVFSHPEQTQDHILQARRLLFFNQRHKWRKIECFESQIECYNSSS